MLGTPIQIVGGFALWIQERDTRYGRVCVGYFRLCFYASSKNGNLTLEILINKSLSQFIRDLPIEVARQREKEEEKKARLTLNPTLCWLIRVLICTIVPCLFHNTYVPRAIGSACSDLHTESGRRLSRVGKKKVKPPAEPNVSSFQLPEAVLFSIS